MKDNQMNKEKFLICLAFLIIIVYLSPLFILGENAHIRVHDNLDSNIAWYKVLAKSGMLFGGFEATIPQIINGLPRNAFGSEFSGIVWLYVLFPTTVAYGLSQAITRIIAFLGMYILLKDHFLVLNRYMNIRVGVALAFAITPFWPSGMLSTLGMPLALWVFLNIRKGIQSWKNSIILTLLPFYSSIVLGFFFFLSAMGVLWVRDVVKTKRWNIRFILAVMYMTLIYLLVEYRLVYSFLFTKEPNSRDEYFHAQLPFWRAFKLTFKNYILGHTHVMTVHTLVILPVLFFAFYMVLKNRRWKEERVFIWLFFLNFALSVWYAFWFYKGWQPMTERFHFMNTFNFARFHFLRPLVIYVSFGLGLKILWEQCKSWKTAVNFLIICQVILLSCYNDELIYQKKPTIKEFYAENQFQEIKDYIHRPIDEYRVASIGLHPAIAQYNGFYTLDSYNNFYPLKYKHEFRKIIEKELDKNHLIKRYFDKWGGRCYFFTDELGKSYMLKKHSKKQLKHINLNLVPFKKMGGQYLFSGIPIKNAKENGLAFEKVFVSKTSAWKIYLYKVL
ncbi:DUF6044 family protein [Bacillus sp. 1NLA3E]|uniref:DUF6044 family protein n=1 Tax=Bacillus sp. 1NLA3E TaxID=666686 RepID=UPI000247E612|nr:DUF6044 family protein [Bacillus sp. 1NLA3E]AGK53836.1 hypothetical protein B1NLA3E_10390 [Bacillus sp. 1NLA3E]